MKILGLLGNYCNTVLIKNITYVNSISVSNRFYIIGYDSNFTITSESDRRQLEQLIIRLGNYVPRVLDRIIEISDMYEKQYCRGEVSHATHVLRTAYDKMFQIEHPMVSFSNPFSSLLSKKETNDNEFSRATILSVLGIAFLKYL